MQQVGETVLIAVALVEAEAAAPQAALALAKAVKLQGLCQKKSMKKKCSAV